MNSIFDFLKEMTLKKTKWSLFTEKEKEMFTPFMIHKIVSMNENYIHIANLAQTFPQSDKEKIYKFYCEFLPKKYSYSKYIKKNKPKMNEEILEVISNFFNCSFGEAEEYLYILQKEGIIDILQKSGYDDKIIKKLLKDIKI
jgi:hypothetical protein